MGHIGEDRLDCVNLHVEVANSRVGGGARTKALQKVAVGKSVDCVTRGWGMIVRGARSVARS